MFARHGIQNALRTRRRSVAFLLLLTLLVTLLGTSLGLSFALQETLRQCRGNYSTIGLVEYLGPGLSLHRPGGGGRRRGSGGV